MLILIFPMFSEGLFLLKSFVYNFQECFLKIRDGSEPCWIRNFFLDSDLELLQVVQ